MILYRYPKIFEDETVGPEAKKLFTEAELKTYKKLSNDSY